MNSEFPMDRDFASLNLHLESELALRGLFPKTAKGQKFESQF